MLGIFGTFTFGAPVKIVLHKKHNQNVNNLKRNGLTVRIMCFQVNFWFRQVAFNDRSYMVIFPNTTVQDLQKVQLHNTIIMSFYNTQRQCKGVE